MGPIEIRRLAVAVAAVPVVCGLIASLLWVLAGGFGGGHGHYDLAIGLLGLPAILVLERVPIPAIFEWSDLLAIIWFPALLNFVLLWGPISLLLWRRSRRDKTA